jgi:TIR domain
VVISPILAEGSRPEEPQPSTGISPEDIPSFWQPGFFRLFISHIAAHKASAHRLKEALARFQIAAFVAHDDIEPTREWQAEIERALRTMDALVAMIAPGFLESRWCDQEVGIAIGRGKLILPLKIGADPHGFMGKYQALQVVGLDAPALAEKIVEVLSQNSLSAERMSESLVDRLANSVSWDSSKRTMSLLERSPRLNASQVARLIRAIDENVDVGQAWGVPERIRALVERIGERTV